MNLTLAARIAVEVVRFEQGNGLRPKKLLVGQVEWNQLREWASEADFRLIPGEKEMRGEYRGMKIYQVDDESYLAVAE